MFSPRLSLPGNARQSRWRVCYFPHSVVHATRARSVKPEGLHPGIVVGMPRSAAMPKMSAPPFSVNACVQLQYSKMLDAAHTVVHALLYDSSHCFCCRRSHQRVDVEGAVEVKQEHAGAHPPVLLALHDHAVRHRHLSHEREHAASSCHKAVVGNIPGEFHSYFVYY